MITPPSWRLCHNMMSTSVRHPGGSRGPKKPLKSRPLDTGFRRYDDLEHENHIVTQSLEGEGFYVKNYATGLFNILSSV